MASVRDKSAQLSWELNRRSRLAVPALAAGVLYLLSGIIASSTLRSAPNVGIVQGLAPALRGQANPAVSPRAAEVRYLSHHAFGLIAGSVVAAISLILAAIVLAFLYDAARYRRPAMPAIGRPLVLYGGIAVALLSVISQVSGAIETHNFATGHDFTNHAVDQALTNATPRVVSAYIGLAAEIALAAGVVIVALNAMRTGLLTRLMGVLGMITAVLFVLPLGQTLSIITSFWFVGLGLLLMGRWPNGDPPAWAAGEAVAWPTAAERAAEREAARDAGGDSRPSRRGRAPQTRAPEPAPKPAARSAAGAAAAVADAPPEPTRPAHPSSKKRKRKRGSR
jgi:hypothetical protein